MQFECKREAGFSFPYPVRTQNTENRTLPSFFILPHLLHRSRSNWHRIWNKTDVHRKNNRNWSRRWQNTWGTSAEGWFPLLLCRRIYISVFLFDPGNGNCQSCSRTSIGIWMVNTVPTFRVEFTSIRPPWRSTASLQKVNPIPVSICSLRFSGLS